MERSTIALSVFALLVHIILTYSVVDIHFQSPIVPGVDPVEPDTVTPAKRLVLVVADGTHAASFLQRYVCLPRDHMMASASSGH